MYKVAMISLGCPKNQVDGEILLKKVVDSGFQSVAYIEESDIVIINTCGFIEDAKTEAIETILEVAQYKTAGLISAIVVTGCLAERYQDEISAEIPEVDAVIGIGANDDIVKVCLKALNGIQTSLFPAKHLLPLEGERALSTPPHWAYLKISDGCSNCCSYCAIPGIRGEFRSRPMESIISEAKHLADNGVKEIILIAQDTTLYGKDLYGSLMLPDLLRELVKIENIVWIRMLYCYPDRINDELIDVISQNEKICSYIDIPLQHCNGDILKAMNRFGDYDSLKSLFKKMRAKIPNIAFRTTFMTGFPAETDAQFEELCHFVKEIEFDKMGCFTFSPEEDTPAASFSSQIDEDVKQNRANTLMDIQYAVTEKINNSKLGFTYDVIVDDLQDEKYFGRAYFDTPEIDGYIVFKSYKKLSVGEIVRVKIIDCEGYDLIGEITE